MDWRDHIQTDPAICHGKPCFAGTRILVSIVLDNLAAGVAHQRILANYPALTEQHISAALAFAAELARDRFLPLTPPKVAS